ncbi:hypothetical protein LUZ61_009417 [Rhynchospora tenuis]|uniref:Uncharacterized protein n=1 Tax=Rhynchospora tenuis TaxID=198213 RepID=A0AAD5ZXD5_9POAL|nr:hypothetical protein LUZ61_009417 [Rhynchospora tenuis]
MTNLFELTTKLAKKQRVQPEPESINDPSDCHKGDGLNDRSDCCDSDSIDCSDSDSLFSLIGQDNSIDCSDSDFLFSPIDQDNSIDCSDSNSLFSPIGRDNSIDCLVRCSRFEYGSLACINRSFRSLIKRGELYQLRCQLGIVEHWIYFICDDPNKWVAYDPKANRWMTPPLMPCKEECFKCSNGLGDKYRSEVAYLHLPDECFKCSPKISLAVGTELLLFAKVLKKQFVMRYSILSNRWTQGEKMNQPRGYFASASLGEKAIVAGGLDLFCNALNSAELYNSETRCWVTISSMNKARKICSGVFMDGKFYVVGGKSSCNDFLTCGEEYDLERETWRVIPNMSVGLDSNSRAPLVAVVRNELYTADCSEMVLRKYDKKNNVWVTLGPMPVWPDYVNKWNVAFLACGDRLLVIGGPLDDEGGLIQIKSWVPDNDGPPQWNILAERHSETYLYDLDSNCAVMGC